MTAGQPQPSSCLVEVHAKTTLTEPAQPRRWQRSEAWTQVARTGAVYGRADDEVKPVHVWRGNGDVLKTALKPLDLPLCVPLLNSTTHSPGDRAV